MKFQKNKEMASICLLSAESTFQDWQDSSVDKVLVSQAQGLEFDSQNPLKAECGSKLLQSQACWPAHLAYPAYVRPVREAVPRSQENKVDSF